MACPALTVFAVALDIKGPFTGPGVSSIQLFIIGTINSVGGACQPSNSSRRFGSGSTACTGARPRRSTGQSQIIV
ncbi:MAG: hypothetical protein M3362_17770 [Acidobacteriota bacterium]|nr:hypothetical protein [Acidobacteriota bacterium]